MANGRKNTQYQSVKIIFFKNNLFVAQSHISLSGKQTPNSKQKVMSINFLAIAVAALIPMVVGFLWYGKFLFQNPWMKAADMTEEKMQGANMGVIFGVSYVLCLFIALALNAVVIHQSHIFSLMVAEPGFGDPNSEIGQYLAAFMENHGHKHRSFGHGALHGGIDGLLLATSVLGVNALFERKGFRYIAINGGFWIVCFALMGGIIAAWH